MIPRYAVTTFSQSIETDGEKDFLDFLRDTSEEPERVEARIMCLRQPATIDPYEIMPPFFRFVCGTTGVSVEIYRSSSEAALAFLSELEQVLQLTPAMPQPEPDKNEEEPRLRRTVFIAHSFDDAGRSYAFQLTKFLNLLRFEVATGEGFAPESISAKVKRRLQAQGIAVAILSEKDDMTWLVQETTSAGMSGKPLIVLVEEGLAFKPGLLGDIDYIRFAKGAFAECFIPIAEGLRELGFRFAPPWQ